MTTLNQMIKTNNITIVSGEGIGEGIVEPYTGKRTMRAIKMRLTKERCGGDRWAKALVFSHVSQCDIDVFINVETGKYC